MRKIKKWESFNEFERVVKTFETFNKIDFRNKTIINVDIQPEYQDYMITQGFDLWSWVEFINSNYEDNEIVFLYNGEDTLGMIPLYEYQDWLLDLGIESEVISNAHFYDKGYAFFRYCIDNDIEEDDISDLVKFMYTNDINDSRDIDEDMWEEFMNVYDHDKNEVRDLLEFAGDCLYIPDLMEELKRYKDIVLLGGGINECLKEVEISLKSLDMDYITFSEYTY